MTQSEDNGPHRGELWQHFKGGYYVVLEIAEHVDTQTRHVVYMPLYQPHLGKVVTRPLDEWMDVRPTGERRFLWRDPLDFRCCILPRLQTRKGRAQETTDHFLDDDCILAVAP